jgi:hypothetical protein
MPIHNPICRLVSACTVGSSLGVSFGVLTLGRSSWRSSRRKLRHPARQNRRSGRPVASAHRPSPGARALALLLSNDAGCLRALANVSASFDCNSPVLWPTTHCGRSWVFRWPEQKTKGGQRRKLSCGRSSSAFPMMPAARPAPDRRPIPSLRSVIPQAGGQARFALKRSTASVALGSAPSSFARWDSLLLLSRTVQSALGRFLLLAPPRVGSSLSPALWGPAQTSLKYAKVLAAFAPVARGDLRSASRHGLRALARKPPCASANCGLAGRLWPKHSSISNQISSRSKSVIMPLIELAPRGKDISLSLILPEETANDVRLYARFLKATHQSATSDIINECVRRTLKQDTEFQTWKSDPENTKSNRGGARPRKARSSTPPQTNRP